MRSLFFASILVLAEAAEAAELRVVDADGRPVEGARVEMVVISDAESAVSLLLPLTREAVTAADGVVLLDVPIAGRSLLLADHPSHAPAVIEGSPEKPPREIRLGRGQVWHGRAVASQDFDSSFQRPGGPGSVCAFGQVSVGPNARDLTWRRCSAIQDGTFRLEGLPSGALTVEAQVPGFLPLVATVDPLQQSTLSLERGVVLAGLVVDGRGRPVSKAVVKSNEGAKISTTAEGRFAMAVRKLPARLEVHSIGFRRWSHDVATTGEIEVRLRPAEQVSGRLMGEGGQPIPKAAVWIEAASDEGVRRSTQHNIDTDDGDFVLDLPGPGTYVLRFRASGYQELRLLPFPIEMHKVRALGVLGLTQGAGVRGVVVDGDDGALVEGALIEMIPAGPLVAQAVLDGIAFSSVSNERGEFTVSGLNIGRYLVRVQRRGRAVVNLLVDLAERELVDLGTVILDSGVEIHGRLLDRNSDPRAKLEVHLFDPAAEMLESFATAAGDAEGRYRFPAVAPGRYRMQVKGDRLLLAQEIEVPRGENALKLDLTVGGVRVHGFVTRGGKPVGGGAVRLTSDLDQAQKRGKILLTVRGSRLVWGLPESSLLAPIDRQGSFIAEDVPSGLVWASYVGAKGERILRSLMVPDQPEARLSIELEGHFLEGRVVDADNGLSLMGAVQLSNIRGRFITEVPTDSQGWFRFEDLAPGTYLLAARASGYSRNRLRQVSVSSETPFQELNLQRGDAGNIQVALSRVDRTGAEGVPVIIFDSQGNLVASLPSMGSGERVFGGLPAGEYTVGWSDPLSGAGVTSVIEVAPSGKPEVDAVLDRGTSIVVACPHSSCVGGPIDRLAIYSEGGVEMTSQLSGISTALRFSESGEVSVGRLSPGVYRFQLWVADQRWDREVTVVRTDRIRISFQ